MESDRWYRLKELFKKALSLEPGDRSAYLDEACRGDDGLRREVEALLAVERKTDDFMETPASPGMTPGGKGVTLVGTQIGSYLIKSVISSGGMGTVYEAVHENSLRIVAVKVMSKGVASKSALRRFEYESQFLAKLRHPNIAEVIESGTHHEETEGVPYFVMEYIPDARPVTQYARANQLAIPERLQLFLQICDAVHHGHQKGVIHRDLKPSNILVDASGQVKIIDFGVARATDSDLHLTTAQTDVGQLIGTVQYMSPEQCKADPTDLDIRSDVYALGVVLYELLCEELPYDVRKALVFEATRIIREVEPKRPSLTKGRLRGDVETIVLKALEKKRALRYQSMADFETDIRRVLRGQVILARPAGLATRTVKWIKRNPVKSTVAGMTIMAALMILAYMVFVAFPQIKQERDHARSETERARVAEQMALEAKIVSEREAETTKTINRFLEQMLSAADPVNRGGEVNVLDILDRAEERIDSELVDRPGIEASLRFTIGITYFNNGLSEAAQDQLRRALEIFTRINGKEDGSTLRAMNWLGYVLLQQGKLSEAEPLLIEAMNTSGRVLGGGHRVTLKSMQFYAALLREQRRYYEAEELIRKTLDEHRHILGEDHVQTLETMYDLALVLWKRGKLEDAAAMLREVIANRSRILGEKHIRTLESMNSLALVLMAQGEYSESESIHREILVTYDSALGGEHPHTLMVMNNLSKALELQGEYAETESILREVLEIQSRISDREHPDVLRCMHNLAIVLARQGKLDEAGQMLQEVLNDRRRVLGGEHVDTLQTMSALADIRWSTGGPAGVERDFREVLEIQTRVLGKEDQDTLITMNNLAVFLVEQGKLDEAGSMLGEVLKIRRGKLGEKHPETLNSMINLADVLKGRGKLDEAESMLREVLRICREVHGDGHAKLFSSMTNLAVVLSMQEKHEEAVGMHREVLELCRRIYSDEHTNTLKSIANLAAALMMTRDYSGAEKLLNEGMKISERMFPQGNFMTATLHSILGDCLIQMRRYEEAEEHLRNGHAGLSASLGREHRRTRNTVRLLIDLYEAWDKPEDAARWREALGEEEASQLDEDR